MANRFGPISNKQPLGADTATGLANPFGGSAEEPGEIVGPRDHQFRCLIRAGD